MKSSRRQFLGASGAAMATAALPSRLLRASALASDPDEGVDYPKLIELGRRAVEAARQAGATYADCRLSIRDAAYFSHIAPLRTMDLHIGVRALVDGYWGFSFSPQLRPEETARLGRDAVFQAGAYNIGKVRRVEFSPIASRTSGHWTMPVIIDPFQVPHEEIADFLVGLSHYIESLSNIVRTQVSFRAERTDKVFVSSEAQETTQRLYRADGRVSFELEDNSQRLEVAIEGLTRVGMGWEVMKKQPLREMVRRAHAEGLEELQLPVIPVDVGRYPMLFDAHSTATILLDSIGHATELDRIMGFEANSGGTSYITDPTQVGNFKIGYSGMRVVANQSIPGAVGWIKWDDEGVAPTPVTLVDNGILAGLQTSRESASWISSSQQASLYQSCGCVVGGVAANSPLIGAGDVSLLPESNGSTLDAMRATIDRGTELKLGEGQFDFQKSTAFVGGTMFGVQKGRRVHKIVGGAALLRTTDFWKSINSVGGPSSVRRIGIQSGKGEPEFRRFQSSSAPAILCKEVSIIDVQRKA